MAKDLKFINDILRLIANLKNIAHKAIKSIFGAIEFSIVIRVRLKVKIKRLRKFLSLFIL